MKIQFIKGDLLTTDADYICHQVNCKGVMNAGLGRTIRLTYPDVYYKYRYACTTANKDLLGCIQIVGRIINIFGQRNYGTNTRQTDYKALELAFNKLHTKLPKDKSLAFPYNFGCGLAGGDWNIVFKLIEQCFEGRTIKIYQLQPTFKTKLNNL